MHFYYSGFNGSTSLLKGDERRVFLDSFTEIPFLSLTDFQIGWGYFLLWRGTELFIMKSHSDDYVGKRIEQLQIPECAESCKKAAIGHDSVIILSERNDIWKYKIWEGSWSKVPNFLPRSDHSEAEYPINILQAGGTIVLTNLGRVFNVPVLVDIPKRTSFVDIACGFDHTILLSENGDIYSMGTGTRGQLGHQDLEDCDVPRLIEALAGLKVASISAGGWHSAVITDQGHLYTWGWNTCGELGVATVDTKVIPVPTLINFADDDQILIETPVKRVQCGNNFTVCVMDDNTIWGCGSNKYGQLGQSRQRLKESPNFVRLQIPMAVVNEELKELKCGEWGTLLVTE